MTHRPLPEEYSAYEEQYVSKVPEGEIGDLLAGKLDEVSEWISELPEELGDYRYAPGKWTLKELLGHMIDTERIMSYRLLRIARGDKTPLPGFNQDLFVNQAAVVPRSFFEISRDYAAVRTATLTLLGGLSEEAWDRSGTASDHTLTVRALAYIIAGHELHHLGFIREHYLD